MAQGDISSAINELVKKLQVNTAASLTTRSEIERYVGEVLDTYDESIRAKKEAYRWDVKRESLSEYLKKRSKYREQLVEEQIARKSELEFINEQINLYKEQENKAFKEGKSALSKELFQRRVELEIQKNVKEAMDDVSNSASNAAKTGNPFLAAIVFVGGLMFTATKMLFNVASSILKIGFGFIKDMFGADFGISAVFETFLKMQSLVGNVSANVGMLARESTRFLENTPTIFNEVLDVGGDLEDIGTVVEQLSKVTNRVRVFDGPQFKRIIELGLGTGLGVEDATGIIGNFENLGISLNETLDFTDYVRGKSMKMSMNQTSILGGVNDLVLSLTGFGITEGLKGMTKLVIDAQRLRIDTADSVNKFKDAFNDPEKAVEVAATANLLGGKFSFYFGNTFELMRKGMEEPQQLTSDLLESMKGKAVKGKNGFEIPPADREMIREFAKSINQNPDELFNVAIEQTKFADKIENLTKQFGSVTSLTEEQRILITNLMTLNEDGSYSIRLSNGVKKLITEIPSINTIYRELAQERKNNESALLRKTLAERIGIAIQRFNVGFSQFFIELNKLLNNSNTMSDLDGLIKDITVNMIDFIKGAFSSGGSFRQSILAGMQGLTALFSKLFDIFTDPNKEFGVMIAESAGLMLNFLNINFVPYLQYAGAEIVAGVGQLVLSDSVKGSALRLKKKAILSAGPDSLLSKSMISDVIEEGEDYNNNYVSYGEDKIDLTKLKKMESDIKSAAIKLEKSKKLDGIQPTKVEIPKSSNVAEKKSSKQSIKTSSNQSRPILLTEKNIIEGRPDDAILFINENANQLGVYTPPKLNIVFDGKINMNKNKGSQEASNVVSKQMLTQLSSY